MRTLSLLKEIVDACFWPIYLLKGKPPWKLGYFTQKKISISSAIDDKNLNFDCLPNFYGEKLDERVLEYPWVLKQLQGKTGDVLDAGSSLNYRYLLEKKFFQEINLTIMTLAPEKRFYNEKNISYLYGDLRNIPIKNSHFDYIISISTIEHIGLDNTLLYTNDKSKNETAAGDFTEALKEFRRVLKPGGKCFITVPFGKPIIKSWYQVFGRTQLEQALEAFLPESYETDFFKYTTKGWIKAREDELTETEFFDVHEHDSLDPDFAAGARGLLCLTLKA